MNKEVLKTAAQWLIWLAYCAVTLFVVLHHEPWRDEAQIWLIAKYATFQQILNEISIVEPHPRLWFFALLPFAKTGMPYLSMSILNWVFASAAMGVFVFFSPFGLIVKAAFAASFLMMHEYAVMARPYSLTILIIFLIAALYNNRLKRPWAYGLLILALFNTSYLVFTLAAALLVLFGYDLWKAKKINVSTLILLGVIVAGAAMVYYQGNHHLTDQIQSDLAEVKFDLQGLAEAVGKAFFVAFVDVSHWLAVTAGSLIMAAAGLYFLQKPRLFFLLAGAWAGLFKIFLYHYPGSVRHHGFFVIILLLVLWIDRLYVRSEGPEINLKFIRIPEQVRIAVVSALVVCFLISVKFTVWTSRMDHRAPFSGSKFVAEVIDEAMDRLPALKSVVALQANYALPVKAHLPDRDFWYADVQMEGTYLHNYKDMKDNRQVSHSDLIVRAGRHFGDLSSILLLSHRPLELSHIAGYDLKLIYSIDKPVWGYGMETYFLYKPVRKMY